MIKPLGTKLLVEIVREANSSLILLNPEAPQKGKVLDIGKDVAPEVKGKTVSFASFAGYPIKDENKEYLIIEQKDILAYE